MTFFENSRRPAAAESATDDDGYVDALVNDIIENTGSLMRYAEQTAAEKTALDAFERKMQGVAAQLTPETPREEVHRLRHIFLHETFGELLADYTNHTGKTPEETNVAELLEWSSLQTKPGAKE